MKPHLLIVDDERNTRNILERFFKKEYKITLAEDGYQAINILKSEKIDIVLSDLRMPKVDGIGVIKATLELENPPPCIIATAYGDVESAVEVMKSGASDFVTKPVNFDNLELLLRNTLISKSKINNKNIATSAKKEFSKIKTKSPALFNILEMIKKVAPTKATVLISGESGTGKELVAEALHFYSNRDGLFLPTHCAALSENLLESELFGHEKGAFTGASETRKGRFELADNGSIFLDEIGEINQNAQVKLLRVLETKSIERVGGIENIKTNARVIAATNRDLYAMVADGSFREDLYFRLNVLNIHLPALRERKEDIPLLINHFIAEFAEESTQEINGISEDTLDILLKYSWPGNIRELRNCIERMVVLNDSNLLSKNNIPDNILNEKPIAITASHELENLEIHKNEEELILIALKECDGNKTKAAEKLGISRRTLHRKLKKNNTN